MKRKAASKNDVVLVGVLKNKRDLSLLFKEHWYRMPVVYAPVKRFQYVAFYQPVAFGLAGKQIRYYAKVMDMDVKKRRELLPSEVGHPRASDDYQKVKVGIIRKLARPIKNFLPRRVSFGFTTLVKLLTAKSILQIYEVADTEGIMQNVLRHAKIKAKPQYRVLYGKKGSRKRYCLDFAVFCKRGQIAIECDNKKAHASSAQKQHDREKDAYLRRHHWTVIRLSESEILHNLPACLKLISHHIRLLRGQV